MVGGMLLSLRSSSSLTFKASPTAENIGPKSAWDGEGGTVKVYTNAYSNGFRNVELLEGENRRVEVCRISRSQVKSTKCLIDHFIYTTQLIQVMKGYGCHVQVKIPSDKLLFPANPNSILFFPYIFITALSVPCTHLLPILQPSPPRSPILIPN